MLCKVAPGDLKHFLLDCSRLQSVRSTYIHDIEQILLCVVPDHAVQSLTNKETAVLHHHGMYYSGRCGQWYLWEGFVNDMEAVSRNLCFALHMKRTILLSEHN